MINARDYKSQAASNHEQPFTNHKQPTAKDTLGLFGRNSIGKDLFLLTYQNYRKIFPCQQENFLTYSKS